jgi:hypothetical protein
VKEYHFLPETRAEQSGQSSIVFIVVQVETSRINGNGRWTSHRRERALSPCTHPHSRDENKEKNEFFMHTGLLCSIEINSETPFKMKIVSLHREERKNELIFAKRNVPIDGTQK